MKSRNSCLILGVLMIALLFPYSAVADWQTGCVDCPRYFTGIDSRSLALDSSGNPHIVYGGSTDGVYYAYYDGVSWHIETVDSVVDWFNPVAIAIDSADNVHISYGYNSGYPDYSSALKYATNASGLWVIQIVDSDGGGGGSSIAIDSSDKVHISYSSDQGLMHMTNASGSWVTEIVDSDGGGASSIAMDSSDKVHISYSYYDYLNYDLKYATNASGSWVTEIVDSEGRVGENNSIAIDSSDKVHISYSSDQGLMHMTNASGSWVTEIVDSDGGGASSIAIDSSDNVHTSYMSSDLKYALNSSGSWVTETVDSSRKARQNASVAIDSADNVHITYVSDQGLMYMTNASGSWVTEIADSNGGWDPSIAVDSSGKAHVVFNSSNNLYYDGSDLKYATNASGSWVTEIIAKAVDNLGVWSSSIAIASDKVHISYTLLVDDGYGYSYYSLKYATNASGSWVIQTVDSGSRGGGADTSIAIDSSDKVHIGYSAYVGYIYGPGTYYDLKYATNASGSWVTEIVDNYYVWNPSIAIDSSDNVYIAYYYYIPTSYGEPGAPYSDIRYATNASGSWVIEIVDSYLWYVVGDYRNSIAIDSTDNVHISYFCKPEYYPPYPSDLKYATNASGLWVLETVDSGISLSMAMDSSDNVYIVYYDREHSDLMYATNKPLPDISVTDSVDPAADLLIPFGEVRGGRSLRQTATVTNTGSADLVIGEVYLTGTDPEQFDIRHDNCSNTAIAPSGSCTIDVLFRPAETGVFGAKLGIDSNDPDTPELYVELTGTGIRKRMKGHK